jgi:hypothetical protein
MESFEGVGRGHSDVEYDNVGTGVVDEGDGFVGGACLPDDDVAGCGEQFDDAGS